MKTKILCDYLVTGDGGSYKVERDQVIYIQDGKIACVGALPLQYSDVHSSANKKINKGKNSSSNPLGKKQNKNSVLFQDSSIDQTIHLKDHLVCPGFINTHTHLAMSLFRGIGEGLPLSRWLKEVIEPLEKKMADPEFVRLGAELSAIELIRFGVTTVFDMYFHSLSSAQAFDSVGLRGIFGEGDSQFWKDKVQDFIKEFSGHPRIESALTLPCPHFLEQKHLSGIKDFQEKNQLSLVIHVAETRQEVQAVSKKGHTPISYLHSLGICGPKTLYVHCVHAGSEDLRMMARSKTPLSHNPESNMKLGSGVCPVSQALELGVIVGLGTDGQASNNNLNMMGEMQTCALLSSLSNKPLKILEILNTVWMGAGKALNKEDQIGSISAGKRADLIGIDLNQAHFYPRHNLLSHLVYAGAGREVQFVMCEGKVLMEKGRIQTIDEQKVYHKAEKLRQKMQV